MRRLLAFVLTLTMLLPMMPTTGVVAEASSATEEGVSIRPFYANTWHAVDTERFDNLAKTAGISVHVPSGTTTVKLGVSKTLKTIVNEVKTTTQSLPEGMRYVRLISVYKALNCGAEAVVDRRHGMEGLEACFREFLQAYSTAGGELDGVVLDVEFTAMQAWDIYSDLYLKGTKDIYTQIENNEVYQTKIRPMLVERGFVFHDRTNDNGKEASASELYSIFHNPAISGTYRNKYKNCVSIWNRVIDILLSEYLTQAIYEPLAEFYPDALVSDYRKSDTYAWHKSLYADGSKHYLGGNVSKVGNTSNKIMYGGDPRASFYLKDGVALYQKPIGYNQANFEDNPYNMFVWNVNHTKNLYAATDTKNLSVWISAYNYNSRAGSMHNTPYYAESILHLGMLDPQNFLVYMNRDEYSQNGKLDEYDESMQVISELLDELTRLAGYSDRNPVETPASWNDDFVLSGMYANGRNLWRLTPNTTDGMTLENFKVAGEDPTFSINGNTITFPGGHIVADGNVSVVGTSGYWIETEANVIPAITRIADRYSQNPSFSENFENYETGSGFTSETALPVQTWEVTSDSSLLIKAQGDGKALALTGTATLNNVKLPAKITAGDSYAKKQIWEVSITLPTAMNSGAVVNLLTCGTDGGFKLQEGNVYYDNNGTATLFGGVTLAAGQKYTLKREVDFTVEGAYKSGYSICDDSGNLVAQIADVAMKTVALPVSTIGFSCVGLTAELLLDDYKLYPTGLAKDFELYNAKTGIQLTTVENNSEEAVAYRLSWMNASSVVENVQVRVARYDSEGTLVSDTVLNTVNMNPGCDGVEMGVVENTTGKITVYLDACRHTNTELRGIVDATCNESGYTGDVVCKDCGHYITAGAVVPAHGHTDAPAIKENESPNSCEVAGTYDSVVYCAVCGVEISRETVTVPVIGHTEEIIPGREATCTESGLTEGKKCSACGEVLVGQNVVPATGHVESEAVKENIVPSTDTTAGSYDLVVYCESCGAELSRESIVVPAGGSGEAVQVLPAPYTVMIGGTEYTLTHYGVPVYSKNSTKTDGVFGSGGAAIYEYIDQTTEGAGEDDWNAKLIWNIGEDHPTLYLNGFVLNDYNEELDAFRWASAGANSRIERAAIFTSSTAPLRIVLQGEDSVIRSNYGIHYNKDLTIVSEGDTKLTLFTGGSGIAPLNNYNNAASNAEGNKLTLNANLDVSVGWEHNLTYSRACILTYKADLVINGGVINTECRTTSANRVVGIQAYSGGDVYIDGGTVYAYSRYSANKTNAAIAATAGNVYISGGNVTAYAKSGAGIRAQNVYITGGTVNLDPYYGGIVVLNSTGIISITGGTVESYSRSSSYSAFRGGSDQSVKIVPQLGEHCTILAGSSAENAVEMAADSDWYTKRYVKLVYPVTDPDPEAGGHTHTEETIAGKEATCTETGLTAGKQCIACGKALVAQETVPAIGHSYDDALDTQCNKCFAIRRADTLAIENNKVIISTGATIKDVVTLTVFYGVNGTVADLNDWGAVAAISKGYRTYEGAAVNDVTLDGDDTYIFRLRYTDATGTVQMISIQKTVTGIKKPEMTVENGKVIINKGSQTNELLTLTVFYGVNGTVADLNDWGAVAAISKGYRTYEGAAVNDVTLDGDDTYIFRLRYTDATGTIQMINIQKTVTGMKKPEMTVENGKVIINKGSQTNELLTLTVFYGVNGTVADLNDWGAVAAISKGYRTYEGAAVNDVTLDGDDTYIFRLRYTDAAGMVQMISIQKTVDSIAKPTVTVDGNKIVVSETAGVELLTLSVFYGVKETVTDLNNWNQLMAASAGYKTYVAEDIGNATLPTDGGYILRLRYNDANGNTLMLSQQI